MSELIRIGSKSYPLDSRAFRAWAGSRGDLSPATQKVYLWLIRKVVALVRTTDLDGIELAISALRPVKQQDGARAAWRAFSHYLLDVHSATIPCPPRKPRKRARKTSRSLPKARLENDALFAFISLRTGLGARVLHATPWSALQKVDGEWRLYPQSERKRRPKYLHAVDVYAITVLIKRLSYDKPMPADAGFRDTMRMDGRRQMSIPTMHLIRTKSYSILKRLGFVNLGQAARAICTAELGERPGWDEYLTDEAEINKAAWEAMHATPAADNYAGKSKMHRATDDGLPPPEDAEEVRKQAVCAEKDRVRSETWRAKRAEAEWQLVETPEPPKKVKKTGEEWDPNDPNIIIVEPPKILGPDKPMTAAEIAALVAANMPKR